MNKLLSRLEWRLHRLNFKFNLLDLYLHDGDDCLGFTLCEFNLNYRPYALLAFEFKLPNGTSRKGIRVVNWDLLFLATPIWKWLDYWQDRSNWGQPPTGPRRLALNLLKKLY